MSRKEDREWLDQRLAGGDQYLQNRIHRIGVERYLDYLSYYLGDIDLRHWKGNDEFKEAHREAQAAVFRAACLMNQIIFSSEDDPAAAA